MVLIHGFQNSVMDIKERRIKQGVLPKNEARNDKRNRENDGYYKILYAMFVVKWAIAFHITHTHTL